MPAPPRAKARTRASPSLIASAVEAKDVTKASIKSAGKIVKAEAKDATGGPDAAPAVAAAHKTSAKEKKAAKAKAASKKAAADVKADATKEAAK